jgi:hypothetical protein
MSKKNKRRKSTIERFEKQILSWKKYIDRNVSMLESGRTKDPFKTRLKIDGARKEINRIQEEIDNTKRNMGDF